MGTQNEDSVSDQEALDFYNLATSRLLTSLEVSKIMNWFLGLFNIIIISEKRKHITISICLLIRKILVMPSHLSIGKSQ